MPKVKTNTELEAGPWTSWAMVGRDEVGRLLLGVGGSALVVAARLANIVQQRQQLSMSRSAIRQSRLFTDGGMGLHGGGGYEQTSTCHMMAKLAS